MPPRRLLLLGLLLVLLQATPLLARGRRSRHRNGQEVDDDDNAGLAADAAGDDEDVDVLGEEEEEDGGDLRHHRRGHRRGKLFPIFQIVTFPNDNCESSGSRNGTCYTTEECNSRGGSSSGTCASGFGVCCVFVLGCGGMSSENCTWLVESSTSSVENPCTYTICPCSTNVCRIRLDFNTFSIAGPQTGQADDDAAVTSTNLGGIGDCITDTFSFTAPGNVGSPIICGFNTGQHMIVDASDSCHVANFGIGSDSGTTRQWDIKVTQYGCGDISGGPDGCLQYFTGVSGKVSSYNFPTTSSTIGATTTHLSSQCYSICFRREASYCAICFTTAITNTVGANTADTENAMTSFGLSLAATATAMSDQQAACTGDYLIIPNGEDAPVTIGTFPVGVERFCGRTFTTIDNDVITGASVCTQTRPFKITFKTDADEAGTTTTAAMAHQNEQSVAPAGIIGFSLNFVQQAC